MNAESYMEGGCLCGTVRYSVSSKPFAAEYCHCRSCQKSAGSVVVNWMDYRMEQVTWTAGKPAEYESSDSVRRGFCANCGSTLSFRDTGYPEYMTLSIASLDDPNMVVPSSHIYTENQVKWLKIDDNCKRSLKGPSKSSA